MEIENKWDDALLTLVWNALSKILSSEERTKLQDEYDELLNKYHEAKEQGPWKD